MWSRLREAQNRTPSPPPPWDSARCVRMRLHVPVRARGSAPNQHTSDIPMGLSPLAMRVGLYKCSRSRPRSHCCVWTMSNAGSVDGKMAAYRPELSHSLMYPSKSGTLQRIYHRWQNNAMYCWHCNATICFLLDTTPHSNFPLHKKCEVTPGYHFHCRRILQYFN